MPFATRSRRTFRWNSPWLIAGAAIVVLIASVVGLALGTRVVRWPNQAGPPVASSPSSASQSPGPRHATRTLVAVVGVVIDGPKRELELVGLDGTVVASTLVDPEVSDMVASAGGDHAAYVDSSGHLWELHADGRTRDLGKLETPSYPGIESRIASFATSPDGLLWAWTAVATDDAHPWPGSVGIGGSPTIYNDVYLGGAGKIPRLVYHEVSDGMVLLYRWTARGPLYYQHPYADLPTPFRYKSGPLTLIDVVSGTTRSMTEDVLDVAADGTVAYGKSGQSTVTFVRRGMETTIDAPSYSSDAQIRPAAVSTTAVIGLATPIAGGGARWSYRTWLIDIASGKMLEDPMPNVRPAWRAWMPDGQVVLEDSAGRGVFVYSPNGSMQTVTTSYAEVIGSLSI